jgi:hypothetical protein
MGIRKESKWRNEGDGHEEGVFNCTGKGMDEEGVFDCTVKRMGMRKEFLIAQ